MPRKTAAKPPSPEPARRNSPRADAAFVAALRDAAGAMLEAGFDDPGWPTFVRVAASELERFYSAGMVAPRLGEKPLE